MDADHQLPGNGCHKVDQEVRLEVVQRDLPRVGDELLARLDVRGAEVDQDVDHEEHVDHHVGVEQRVRVWVAPLHVLKDIQRRVACGDRERRP